MSDATCKICIRRLPRAKSALRPDPRDLPYVPDQTFQILPEGSRTYIHLTKTLVKSICGIRLGMSDVLVEDATLYVDAPICRRCEDPAKWRARIGRSVAEKSRKNKQPMTRAAIDDDLTRMGLDPEEFRRMIREGHEANANKHKE